MKLYIKNMVCLRCMIAVREELTNLGLSYTTLELGMVDVPGSITAMQQQQFKTGLTKWGLELIDDKKNILIERIKTTIISLLRSPEQPNLKYSEYISKALHHNYTYLSNQFTRRNGISIRHFIILQKVERVKEMLLDDELTLCEIAYLLDYSSAAHLSGQFKKVTGITPTQYRRLKPVRMGLENL